MLTRRHLVNLFYQAILDTRQKITIVNQVSGYLRFHNELNEHSYLVKQVRDSLEEDYPKSMYAHDLIEYAGLGNCTEVSEFLRIEISQKIHEFGALAEVSAVAPIDHDHMYLNVKIKLKDEENYSYWEVDAWDPRIIDISPRPDGTIKNEEYLDYGYRVIRCVSASTNEIDYHTRYSFFHVPKPIEGRSVREVTPFDKLFKKHKGLLHEDKTIEEAIEDGKLPPYGDIGYLQMRSGWQ